MEDAIKKLASERRAPVSEVIREAIEEYLKARDIQIATRVKWGVATEKPDKPNPEYAAARAG
jgi:predicted transcriptional regulator